MGLTSWRPSTVQIDDYSAGASVKDSINQWTLKNQFEVTSTDVDVDSALRKKFILCWFILREFPNEGLDELIESVRDIWEFYDTDVEDETHMLPVSWKTKAGIDETYTRPVSPIVEDEDLLIDERIETKPKAVYKAKVRIRSFHRAKPLLPIGDDIEMDLLDE